MEGAFAFLMNTGPRSLMLHRNLHCPAHDGIGDVGVVDPAGNLGAIPGEAQAELRIRCGIGPPS